MLFAENVFSLNQKNEVKWNIANRTTFHFSVDSTPIHNDVNSYINVKYIFDVTIPKIYCKRKAYNRLTYNDKDTKRDKNNFS